MSFATVVCCIDGRTHQPILRNLKKYYDVDFFDLITEAGPDKILSENTDEVGVQSIRRGVENSLKYHKSNIICVVGHHDCAANNAFHEEHREQLLLSVANLKKWYPGKTIDAYFVNHHYGVDKI